MEKLKEIKRYIENGDETGLKSLDFVYPKSVNKKDGEYVILAKLDGKKSIIVGPCKFHCNSFEGQVLENIKVCPLTHTNAWALRKIFPFASPVFVKKDMVSFGTGDRVGLATPGHIHAFEKFNAFPIFAQQSMREMGRTERSPQKVIDDATFGVYQEGYKNGFAADADHIKTAQEAVMCLNKGYTMFTIDAADYINKQGVNLSDKEAVDVLNKTKDAEILKENYTTKEIILEDGNVKTSISFLEAELGRAVAVYQKAIEHMKNVYDALLDEADGKQFTFEVSIDETEADTLPRDHYFVANELKRLGVKFDSLAPKFIGQFQKGIDYIGDKSVFEEQFSVHALIANKCGGYKISVHSGSDKFSIFPIVGKYTSGYFHAKTAGTSWLEALRVAAHKAPDLYRKMHEFALKNFEKDRQSYHVTTDLNKIPDINSLKDNELPELLDKVDSRQLMHITYGSILSAKDENNNYVYKTDLFRVLDENEDLHYSFLEKHMVKHMEYLGIKRN